MTDLVTRVTALCADPNIAIRDLVGSLAHLEKEVTKIDLKAKPYKEAIGILRTSLLEKLGAEQAKTLNFDGVGSISRSLLKTYKTDDPMAFRSWLERKRTTLGDPMEIYSYFGSALSKDMLNADLTADGVLPDGISIHHVPSLRFTAAKES